MWLQKWFGWYIYIYIFIHLLCHDRTLLKWTRFRWITHDSPANCQQLPLWSAKSRRRIGLHFQWSIRDNTLKKNIYTYFVSIRTTIWTHEKSLYKIHIHTSSYIKSYDTNTTLRSFIQATYNSLSTIVQIQQNDDLFPVYIAVSTFKYQFWRASRML